MKVIFRPSCHGVKIVFSWHKKHLLDYLFHCHNIILLVMSEAFSCWNLYGLGNRRGCWLPKIAQARES